jgi:hypothetical protein
MRVAGRTVVSLLLVAVVLAGAWLVGLVTDLVGERAGVPSRDRAFVITDFDRDVVLARDGSLAVTETIQVRFDQPRRGIFRDLPASGPGGQVTYRDVTVDRGAPDQPWTFRLEQPDDGDGIRVRIGEPAVTLPTGPQTYRLSYAIDGLTFHRTDREGVVQLRLDVPGFRWPTDVEATRLQVTSPTSVLDVACVEGRTGATAPCATEPTIEGRQVSASFGAFEPGRAATVAIDVDASGFVAGLPTFRPDPLDRSPSLLPVTDLPLPLASLLLAVVLAVPLMVFEAFKSVVVYRDVVTDPALHDRLHPTAVFAPPYHHRPAEVAGLLLRRAAEPAFLSTLVDLDQRGHVTTAATADGATLTIRPAAADAPARTELLPWEQALLQALLPGGTPARLDGSYDKDTATRVGSATNLAAVRAARVFAEHGYLHERGVWLRSWGKVLLVLGWLGWVFLATAATTATVGLPVPAAVAVAVVVASGWAGVRWLWREHRLPLTSEGRDVVAQTRAFREYLASVEAPQLEWAAGQPGIDHQHPAVSLLPYAIAFGLADSWYDRFGPLLRELAVTAGTAGAAGGAAWWASASGYGGVRAARAGTVTAPSSSSGGGSFGGGGGGSGGGGGGGGSW